MNDAEAANVILASLHWQRHLLHQLSFFCKIDAHSVCAGLRIEGVERNFQDCKCGCHLVDAT